MSLTDILFLYLAFRAKQLVCDYFLQSLWMALGKCKPFSQGGAKPLSLHAGIHAAFTLLIVVFFAPQFWWLAPVDFCVHFSIDKTKALIAKKYGWTYKDRGYWWAFGIDQEAHNLSHLAYIVIIVMGSGAAL